MEIGEAQPQLSQPLSPCFTTTFYNGTMKAADTDCSRGCFEIQNFCTLCYILSVPFFFYISLCAQPLRCLRRPSGGPCGVWLGRPSQRTAAGEGQGYCSRRGAGRQAARAAHLGSTPVPANPGVLSTCPLARGGVGLRSYPGGPWEWFS